MTDQTFTLTLASNGRVVIPASVRTAMGIGDGDRVIGRVENGALIIEPVAAAVRRAQALVAKHARTHPSVVEELIAERRAEAMRE
jgi:AbrB family looped-hinge helix DNA binding protein